MGIVTDGLVAHYRGAKAKLGTAPGNNSDPTSTWDDLTGGHDGALSGYTWATTRGWIGAASDSDTPGPALRQQLPH